ncbi:hypothetical protein [Halorussus halophilus]|uniref:hypothetical protein n=1 Tax=Halorussus halophilus TaxID=2650975 RepID=UPI0013014515|nr:hypothetical protein [Halorussus halophilus]
MGSVRSRIPATARALYTTLAESRDPRVLSMVLLRQEVESEIASITERLFLSVERDLQQAREDGELNPVPGAENEQARFDYDTRLVLPAMLTLARIHVVAGDVPVSRAVGDVNRDLVAQGRETTRNIVRALLDGDMRDAINDEEYEDFQTNLQPRPQVAELAQESLQDDVESWFDHEDTPETVRTYYEHAVELSERHQEEDQTFRELLDNYREASADERTDAAEDIREQYKFADAESGEALFGDEFEIPYFATQYARVGILYEDMLNMYEADLGLDLGDGFKRAIVLMVIGAQIGLDDTDDYPEDKGTQLTPVTAELNIADSRAEGVETLRRIVEAYLDRAAAAVDDHLTRIAIEYIREQSLDRIDGLRA